MMNKIFGIGLSHTGTRSLDKALNFLGVRSIHWPLDRRTFRELSSGIYRLSLLKEYDAITDITASPFYAQFDRAYPGSKFILTVRDKEAWLASMQKFNQGLLERFEKNFFQKYLRRFAVEERHKSLLGKLKLLVQIPSQIRMVEYLLAVNYGGLAFHDRGRLSYAYDLHEQNVKSYFKDRPGDLLVLDVCAGEGWEKLCAFISKPMPKEPFPHVAGKK